MTLSKKRGENVYYSVFYDFVKKKRRKCIWNDVDKERDQKSLTIRWCLDIWFYSLNRIYSNRIYSKLTWILVFSVVSKHIVNKKMSMVCYFGRPATLTRLELLANRNSRSFRYDRQYLGILSKNSRGVQVKFSGICS